MHACQTEAGYQEGYIVVVSLRTILGRIAIIPCPSKVGASLLPNATYSSCLHDKKAKQGWFRTPILLLVLVFYIQSPPRDRPSMIVGTLQVLG